MRINERAIDQQLQECLKPESEGKSEYPVAFGYTKMLGADEQEHQKSAFHHTNSALKTTDCEIDPMVLDGTRLRSAAQDYKSDEYNAACRPLEDHLGQILQSGKGLE